MLIRPSNTVHARRGAHHAPVGVVACMALSAMIVSLLAARPAAAQLVPKEMPTPVRGLDLQDKRGQQVPLDLSFFDEDANAVALRQYFNRPGTPSDGSSRAFSKPVVVLMVYYTCPLQCPQTLEGLHQVLNGVDGFTVGNEYDVLIVSFDPRDKPRDAKHRKIASLLAYNRPTTDAIRNGWTYLTSSATSARSLADAIGFPFRFLPESGEFAHPTAVYVLTPEGKVSRQFNGVRFPSRDLRFALMEASSGRIGDTFEQFTFWCYHFDPESGGYTLQAMRVMQLGGSVCAVLLAGLLVVLLRQERRKARRLQMIQAGLSDPLEPAATSQGDGARIESSHEPRGAVRGETPGGVIA